MVKNTTEERIVKKSEAFTKSLVIVVNFLPLRDVQE